MLALPLQAPMPVLRLGLRVPAPELPEEVEDDLPLLSAPASLVSESAVAAVFLGVRAAALQLPM